MNAEFLRITTKPLQSKFLSQMDHFSDKLIQIFQSKGGVKGQKIKCILAMTDSVSINASNKLSLYCIEVFFLVCRCSFQEVFHSWKYGVFLTLGKRCYMIREKGLWHLLLPKREGRNSTNTRMHCSASCQKRPLAS